MRQSLLLKKNAPQARTIRELSGEVDLFAPKHDPDSIVKVENFQKLRGKPMASPLLSSAGVELNNLTREQAEALVKSESLDLECRQCEMEQLATIDKVPHITLQIKNPNQKLVALEFQDADGHQITGTESWGSLDVANDWMSFEFDSKLPDTARLVIYLATPKSLVKVPFSFTNVSLP